jgi:hypothetical protein
MGCFYAISAIVLNCQLAGFQGTEDAVAKYALSHIDLIIQVDRHIDENNNRTFSAFSFAHLELP